MEDIVSLYRSEIFIKKSIGSIDQRHRIVEQLYEYRNHNGVMTMSNDGCFRIDKPDVLTYWLEETLNDLIYSAVSFYTKQDFMYNVNINELKIHHWANINNPGSRNTIHAHKQSHFSAVYYLQAENTGNLRFLNPANVLGDCNSTAPFVRDFIFQPSDGDFILWPAWVPHEVEPNYSNNDRVNLAFDIAL